MYLMFKFECLYIFQPLFKFIKHGKIETQCNFLQNVEYRASCCVHFLLFVYFIMFLPASFCEKTYAPAHAINPPGRRRIFEINSRPKINSHEKSRVAATPTGGYAPRSCFKIKLSNPSLSPSFGPFIPPGLSIPLS